MQPVPWQPTASLEMLRTRAGLLAGIRRFFAEREVLEVETPVCARSGTTDPAIESLHTRYIAPGAADGVRLYLQTSPEFPMKRLLAAGSGPIYQICHVFRNGELGRRHNPEFTLLEWYRPGFDHLALMDEVTSLVGELLPGGRAEERLSYREAYERYLQIDPHSATIETLRHCALEQGIVGAEALDLESRDGWLDLLLSHLIEPHLGRGRLTYLYNYPASQAALSRIRPGYPPLAERFELYLEGMEIANGFHELSDTKEQRERFEADNKTRQARGQATVEMDRQLLAALEAGLPDCAGVALGVDRLLMVLTGQPDIRQVLAFACTPT
jgi:lysyl-tRNA synthetase class 2